MTVKVRLGIRDRPFDSPLDGSRGPLRIGDGRRGMEEGGSRSTVISRRVFTLDEEIPPLIKSNATLPSDESPG